MKLQQPPKNQHYLYVEQRTGVGEHQLNSSTSAPDGEKSQSEAGCFSIEIHNLSKSYPCIASVQPNCSVSCTELIILVQERKEFCLLHNIFGCQQGIPISG